MEINDKYKFIASVSKDAYNTKEECTAAVLSGPDGKKARKTLNIARQISYHSIYVTPSELLNYALNGYTFCTYHDNFPKNDPNSHDYYTYSDGYYSMKSKSSQFFMYSNFVGIDIDKTAYKSVNDFLSKLSYEPTFWYTSMSHQKDKPRFRLIYVFDDEITGQFFFRYCSSKVLERIESETQEEVEDKCSLRCDQYFNGTNKFNSETEFGISNKIYSWNDFGINLKEFIEYLSIYCEYKSSKHNKKIEFILSKLGSKKFSQFDINYILIDVADVLHLYNSKVGKNFTSKEFKDLTNLISKFEKEYINTKEEVKIDERLIRDSERLKIEEFSRIYGLRYPKVYRTESENWLTYKLKSGEVKYQVCQENYLELKWISKVLTDHKKRRKNMFHRTWLRRLIFPELTPDEAFYNLIIDRDKFFDNSDNALSSDTLIHIVKSAFEFPVEHYIETFNDIYEDVIEKSRKKKIIIHWSSRSKVKANSLLKELKYDFLDTIYNYDLSVKENIELLSEEGVKLTKSVAYRYLKSRNKKTKNSNYELFKQMHQENMSLNKELEFLEDNGLKITKPTLIKYKSMIEEENSQEVEIPGETQCILRVNPKTETMLNEVKDSECLIV